MYAEFGFVCLFLEKTEERQRSLLILTGRDDLASAALTAEITEPQPSRGCRKNRGAMGCRDYRRDRKATTSASQARY